MIKVSDGKKFLYNNGLLACLSFYILLDLLGNTVIGADIMTYIRYFRFIVYFIFIFDIINDILAKNRRVTIFALLICLFSGAIFLVSRQRSVLVMTLLLLELSKFDLKIIIKNISITAFLGICVVIFCSLVGILENVQFPRENTIRYGLGFGWTTTAPNRFVFVCLGWLYIRKHNISFLELFLMAAIHAAFYYLTDTRLAFYVGLLIVIAGVVFKFSNNFSLSFLSDKKILSVFLSLIPVLLFITSILFVYFYSKNNSLFIKIDELLSGRLHQSLEAYKKIGVNLFGNNVVWRGWSKETVNMVDYDYMYVDNSYLKIMFEYGIVGICLILIGYSFAIKKAVKDKDGVLVFSLIICCVHATISPSLVGYGENMFLYTLSYFLIKNQIKIPRLESESFEIENIFSKCKDIKLSIIMPIFNGEKNVEKSLNNLFELNMNKEIIVINDCSTDNTLNILNTYSNKITLINLDTNQGVSKARNIGKSIATGEFITFIDVDDYVDIRVYPKIIAKMIENDADVGVFNYVEVFGKNSFVKSKYKYENIVLPREEILNNYLLDKISPAPWDKVYKKSVLEKISFDETLHVGEDLKFCLQLFSDNRLKTIAFLEDYAYHYMQNSNSVMHCISPKLLEFNLVVESIETDTLNILQEEYQDEFEFFCCEMLTRGIHSLSVSCNKKNKKQVIDYLKVYCTKENLNRILRNKHISKSIKIECFVIKVLGLKVHLFLTPMYKLIKTYRRNNQ